MAHPIRVIVFLQCLCLLSLVFSFNLEPRIPIVKNGTPGSHFGYTVAQHQSIVERAPGRVHKTSWILVGAPKDHNLQPGTNRSGALWKCPLTTNITDCQQVYTDGFKTLDETLSQPAEYEIKDGQWLGVTLKSQGPGGKVLVCAHRYMHKGKGFQWGFGLCYILSQMLDVDDYLEPCRGKPVNEGHQQYGFCQAGTSGLLLDDEAVLGVPGPYTWRGTVHTSNISDDFLLKDKTQYFGPVTENNSPVDKYSYLGYSVTAGHFFGNYMSYVGGAPRSNGTGQVVFFSREKIGNSLLRVDLILNGEMFASSFGFEVLAVDINGDRHDDLVVGAPFYHTRTASGAVYIYMNNDGGFTTNHPNTMIKGSAGETRFGFSMTSLGDLNHDGFMDVAVGAPYEGRGAIYIYLGSQDGLIKDPAQVCLNVFCCIFPHKFTAKPKEYLPHETLLC
ncbi:integrin alpha-PS1-like isoform X2 [Panulirus ornatus]|uniref:integrin alpha-PS1-like isoform X2 n=1 Tax=Panulirus ornatus TaxID=150431 RepID=UPI003A852D73